jgi:hypothetical protein
LNALVVLALCVLAGRPVQAQQNEILVPLVMSDSLGPIAWIDTLTLGFHPQATLCLDEALGEFFIFTECGLFSQHCWQFMRPPGAARRLCTETNFPILLDLRPYRMATQVDTFCIGFVATYPVTIRWPSDLAGRFLAARIQDEASFISPSVPPRFIVDMLKADSVRIDSALTYYNGVVIVTTGPGSTGVTSGESLLPMMFALAQNYPNPFNPTTTIRYALPHSTYVTLTVYNTLGQQVAQLVNERQQAGYHDVIFHGDGLASGVYFYKLEGEGMVEIRKMLLMK